MRLNATWLGAVALTSMAAPLWAQTFAPQHSTIQQLDTPKAVIDDSITEAQLKQHIDILASDEFEGRGPGTTGEAKAIGYIAQQWANAGLQGGLADGRWYDPVELIESKAGPAKMAFKTKGRTIGLPKDSLIIRGRDAVTHLQDVPVVFAGYGVDADGKVAADVAGKLVVILMKEPITGPIKELRARRDAVAKAGAAAVFVISEEQVPWDMIKKAYASGTTIASRQQGISVDGMISPKGAQALFKANKIDWANALRESDKPNFAGITLKSKANVDATTNIRIVKSHNVIGKIPGKLGADKGVIVFLGHWDHLGICRPEGAVDRICNGAVDNASGIAVLIEAAKRLAKKQPDRDIYFLATTAEEMGLLGAYAFADKPVVPLDKIVAAFNIDTIAVVPKGERVAILGRGTTNLDADIDAITRSLGREPETGLDSNVMVNRQDGWALKARGVPALMVSGSFADMKKLMAYLEGDYHQPEDQPGDKIILSGAAEDADLHVAIGKHFGSVTAWPGTAGK